MRGDEARFADKVVKRLELLGSRYQIESKRTYFIAFR